MPAVGIAAARAADDMLPGMPGAEAEEAPPEDGPDPDPPADAPPKLESVDLSDGDDELRCAAASAAAQEGLLDLSGGEGNEVEFSPSADWWTEALGGVWPAVCQAADAQGVSEWGLLGAVLTRAGPLLGPGASYDSWKGAPGTLPPMSLFTTLLATTHLGKSDTLKAARHLVPYTEGDGLEWAGQPEDPYVSQPPSASGLRMAFWHWPAKEGRKQPPPIRVWGQLIEYDEGEDLEMWITQGAGQGIPIELRKGWAGQTLGLAAADEKRKVQPIRRYALSALVACQPVIHAGIVGTQQTIGTWNRWIVLPTFRVHEPPEYVPGADRWPSPLDIRRPSPPPDPARPAFPTGRYQEAGYDDRIAARLAHQAAESAVRCKMSVEPSILSEAAKAAADMKKALRAGKPALAGAPWWWKHLPHGEHALWLRLRLAALIAACADGGADPKPNGGLKVRRCHWDAAAVLMQVSARMRHWWWQEHAEARRKETEDAGVKDGVKNAAAEGVKHDRLDSYVDKGVGMLRTLSAGSKVNNKMLSDWLGGRRKAQGKAAERNLVTEILAAADSEGWIAPAEVGRGWRRTAQKSNAW